MSREASVAHGLRLSIAVVWIATALTCAHPYYKLVGAAYLARLGLGPMVMYATCAGELALGVAIVARPIHRALVLAQVAVVAAFTVILAAVEPALLVSPFGVLSKNISFVLVLLALDRERRHGFDSTTYGLIRVAASLPWLTEGLFPKILFQQSVELAMAPRLGLTFAAPSTVIALVGVCQLTSFVLAWVLHGRPWRALLALQATALVFLPLIIGALDPRLWVHPFGPFSKNAPVLAATLALLLLRKKQ